MVGLFYSGGTKRRKGERGTLNGERGTGNRENGGKKPNVNPVRINNSLTHCYFFPFFKWNFPVPLELRKLLEA